MKGSRNEPTETCTCIYMYMQSTDSAYYMYMYMYLLDIPRQPTCMKLGIRELYQPIHTISWLGSYMSVA